MRLRRRFFALFFCSPTHVSSAQNDILNNVRTNRCLLCVKGGGTAEPWRRDCNRTNNTATIYVNTPRCHPESEDFKRGTKNESKDLCRPAATTNIEGKIKNIPSKKYHGCDFVADSSHSFLFSHTHLFCSEWQFKGMFAHKLSVKSARYDFAKVW